MSLLCPPPCIETPRCVLTLLCPDNVALLSDYREKNRSHLAPWEPAADPRVSLAEACRQAARRSWQGYAEGSALQFVAVSRASQRMVAGCNFTNIVRGPLQACHLGYSVDQELQGQGLMREVAEAAIRHMFDSVGLHRIMANHMPANRRSENLLRALGFEREGYARTYLKIAGKWEDMVLNALVNPRA
ncbi:MAG: GNAT family N-acetyltransferase [Rhodoferax sp.]|uniref:GNAT family N-acetyltransferase n=1 Tax=Rhodoferax sp. TaxID=50421 RepID=UPI00261E2AAD|nr:GNAT family N-acetyltransferase [Rhodoferax sp.]MDD5332839.1 GNAT family N-acetyltransferase [Rhodoferax sp.]